MNRKITLVRSRFFDTTPDLALLQCMEEDVARSGRFDIAWGAPIFRPRAVAVRFWTLLHRIWRQLPQRQKQGAIVSLGLSSSNYLYSKTFPHFARPYQKRVLWCYDVWEPQWKSMESLVRDARIDILLLSSWAATQHFRTLKFENLAPEDIHWLPETINAQRYQSSAWHDREIDVLSFGRNYSRFHQAMESSGAAKHFRYDFQGKNQGHTGGENADTDTGRNGMKSVKLQFPTHGDLVRGLANSKICICFPRSTTHPDLTGQVSTTTLRYLQAMSANCLILGNTTQDLEHMLPYNPVVEVDWNDPVGQISHILANPASYQSLIERNSQTVRDLFSIEYAISFIESAIKKHSSRQ